MVSLGSAGPAKARPLPGSAGHVASGLPSKSLWSRDASPPSPRGWPRVRSLAKRAQSGDLWWAKSSCLGKRGLLFYPEQANQRGGGGEEEAGGEPRPACLPPPAVSCPVAQSGRMFSEGPASSLFHAGGERTRPLLTLTEKAGVREAPGLSVARIGGVAVGIPGIVTSCWRQRTRARAPECRGARQPTLGAAQGGRVSQNGARCLPACLGELPILHACV